MARIVRRALLRLRTRKLVASGRLTLWRSRVNHTRSVAGEWSILGFSPYRSIESALMWWFSLFTARGVIGWTIGAFLSVTTLLTWQSGQPPSHMVSSIEDDGLAVVGDVMVIKYHNIKRRYCKGVVSRWLFDPDFVVDGRRQPLWISLGTSAAPPTPLGDQYYSLELTIPMTVRPGNYHYTATTDYSCGLFAWLEPPTAHTPDMIVQLVRPSPGAPPKVLVVPADGSVTVLAQPH